jgi:hypothetical protein
VKQRAGRSSPRILVRACHDANADGDLRAAFDLLLCETPAPLTDPSSPGPVPGGPPLTGTHRRQRQSTS